MNGIVTFGPSAFTVALSFVLPLVLKDFGLRDTLLGFAGMGVTISIATLAWKPLVKRDNSQGKGFEDPGHASEVSMIASVWTWRERERESVCVCVCVCVCAFP